MLFLQVIPLGWALMERRTLSAYKALFSLLKQVCPNFNPETIITDWEYAQQKAWQEHFPSMLKFILLNFELMYVMQI
jgi:hypothetical protein